MKTPDCIKKHEVLSQETQNWLRTMLENEIAPILVKDVSSYAPGRMRTWMPYEAPLDTAVNKNKPFVPSVLHDELWQWIVDLCDKWGMKAQTALISKGGNIKAHRDTTYAAEWAFGINLGACEWGITSDRQSANVDYVMKLKGGEVFSFNSKHVHRVENASPDRWAINVWAIADTKAAHSARIAERIEEMLGKNPDLDDFIRRHQPGAGAIALSPQTTTKEVVMKKYLVKRHTKDGVTEQVLESDLTQVQLMEQMRDAGETGFTIKVYREEVVPVPQTTTTETPSQTKEKKMKIFHWLEESDVTNAAGVLVINEYAKDAEMVMVITNDPAPDRLQAFQDAQMSTGSAKYNEHQWLMPIKTGTWSFHYLERLSEKGIKFTVAIRRLDLMMEMWDDRDNNNLITVGEHLAGLANLAWVDNKSLFLVDIHGVDPTDEFDWSLIGITANDAKKLTKRMAEVVRLSKSVRKTNMKVLALTPELKSNNPDFWVKTMDGKNVIRFSALPWDMQRDLKKRGHLHVMGRGFTRVDGKKVLVKGDYVVIPDELWAWGKVGVVAHTENLKTEVTLEDDTEDDLWTFWEHAPLHVTTWDQQTMLNYPKILTVDSMRQDYLAEMTTIDEQLQKGLLPGQVESDVQTQAEDEEHDEFKRLLPKSDEIRKNRDLATKIKDAGFDIRMFENLIGLSVIGYADSKAKFLHTNQKDQWGNADPLFGMHDKHVVVMRNSFRATCVTDTFLKHFAGMSYRENRVAYYDPRWGMIWNGEHFARTFELHGTHDNDDMHFFVPVKLWSSQPSTVADLKKAGVMLNSVQIPEKEQDAKLMLLVLRLPNGAGEYSLMEFDFSTWPEEIPFDESLIKTYDLSFMEGWVKPQPMVIPKNMPGIPTSRVYSKQSYTRADLLTDLNAQYINPGFGAMCNALVSYSSITRGGIPSCMTDSLGNIVDATQQGADVASFEAITALMDDIKDELVRMGRKKSLFMNRYFYFRRGAVVKKAIKASVLSVRKGQIEEFDADYKRIYSDLKNNVKNKYSFFMRRAVKLNQDILKKLSFTEQEIESAKEFVLKMQADLLAVDGVEIDIPISKFTMPIRQAILREKRHEIVDAAIASIEAMENPHRAILCIWYTILKPYAMGSDAKHGHMDRVVCQMGSERALAHLLIDAIIDSKELCVNHNPIIDDDRRRCENCGKS